MGTSDTELFAYNLYTATFKTLDGKQFSGNLKDKTVCLGISVGQKYHEDDQFHATLDLVKDSGANLLWFVACELQYLNFLIQDPSLKEPAARSKARSKGDQWVDEYRRYITSNNSKVVRWYEIEANPEIKESNDDNNVLILSSSPGVPPAMPCHFRDNLLFFEKAYELIRLIDERDRAQNIETLILQYLSEMASCQVAAVAKQVPFNNKTEKLLKHGGLHLQLSHDHQLLLSIAYEFYKIVKSMAGIRTNNFKQDAQKQNRLFEKDNVHKYCIKFAVLDIAMIVTMAMDLRINYMAYPLRDQKNYNDFYTFIEKISTFYGMEILRIDIQKALTNCNDNQVTGPKSDSHDNAARPSTNSLFWRKPSTTPIPIPQSRMSIDTSVQMTLLNAQTLTAHIQLLSQQFNQSPMSKEQYQALIEEINKLNAAAEMLGQTVFDAPSYNG